MYKKKVQRFPKSINSISYLFLPTAINYQIFRISTHVAIWMLIDGWMDVWMDRSYHIAIVRTHDGWISEKEGLLDTATTSSDQAARQPANRVSNSFVSATSIGAIGTRSFFYHTLN